MKKYFWLYIVSLCIMFLILLNITNNVQAATTWYAESTGLWSKNDTVARKGIFCLDHDNDGISTDDDVSGSRHILAEVSTNSTGYLSVTSYDWQLSKKRYKKVTKSESAVDISTKAFMSYACTFSGDYSAKADTGDHNKHWYSYFQWILWSKSSCPTKFFDKIEELAGDSWDWIEDIGSLKHSSWWTSEEYTDYVGEKTLKSKYSQCEDFQNESNNYYNPIVGVGTGNKVIWSFSNNIGPFKVTYNDSSTILALDYDNFCLYDESGTQIDSSKWYLVNSSTSTTQISTIASATDFYIHVDDSVSSVGMIRVAYDHKIAEASFQMAISVSGNQLQMGKVSANVFWQDEYADLAFTTERQLNNLKIKKVDNSNQSAVSGIGFTVYDNYKKEYLNASGQHTGSRIVHYTNNDGEIIIQNINVYSTTTTYTITEVDSTNLYYKSNSGITKTVSYLPDSTGWVVVTIGNSKAYSLNLQKRDTAKNASLTAKFAIQYQDGTWLTAGSGYNSTATNITVTSNLTISGIKRGTYYIYETEAPSGYDLTKNEGYNASLGWVYVGSVIVGNEGTGKTSYGNNGSVIYNNEYLSPTVMVDNALYVKIRGFVWIEQSGKTMASGSYNNQYDSQTDSLLSGIKVELWKKEIQSNGTVIDVYTRTNNLYRYEENRGRHDI